MRHPDTRARGGVPERSNGAVSKTVVPAGDRGFESPPSAKNNYLAEARHEKCCAPSGNFSYHIATAEAKLGPGYARRFERCEVTSPSERLRLTDVSTLIAEHKITRIDELLPWRYAAAAA